MDRKRRNGTGVKRIDGLSNALGRAVEDAIEEKNREIADLGAKLETAEKHIEACERALMMISHIAMRESQENWPNVKERLWALTAEFADEPRVEVGPLKAYQKNQDEREAGPMAREG